MARPFKFTTEQCQRIESYKGKLKPGPAVKTLAAEGIVVSRSTIVRMWDALDPPPALDPTPGVEPPDPIDEDLPKILREAIRDARGGVRAAKTKGLDADMTKHQDRLFKAIALLDKITPAPPPNPNDNPLVRLSAEACIMKLHELLDRV